MRTLFLLICVFYIVKQGYGQDSLIFSKYHTRKPIAISLLVGPSQLLTRGIVYNDVDPIYQYSLQNVKKIGYSIGLGLSRQFAKHFALNARLLFEKKKYQVNWNFFNLYNNSGQVDVTYLGTNYYDVTNDYLTISITPEYVFGRHFSIGVGGYFGELVKSSTDAQYRYVTPYHDYIYNSIREYSKYDFGFSFKAGYSYYVKKLILSLYFIDNYGIKSVPSRSNSVVQPHSQQNSQTPWYNNSYSFLLGISYTDFNKKIAKKY